MPKKVSTSDLLGAFEPEQIKPTREGFKIHCDELGTNHISILHDIATSLDARVMVKRSGAGLTVIIKM